MNVLVVRNMPPSETLALPKHTMTVAELLRKAGHRVDILWEGDVRFTEATFGSMLSFPIQALPAICRRVALCRYDVIDIAAGDGAAFGTFRRLAPWTRATAYVFRSPGFEHRIWEEERRDAELRLSPRLVRRRALLIPLILLREVEFAVRSADHALVTSTEEKDFILKRHWLDAERITVGALGVSQAFLNVPEHRRSGILFVGTWVHRKGIHYLVSAYHHILIRRPGIRLTIVPTSGTSPEEVLSWFNTETRAYVRVLAPMAQEADLARVYASHEVFMFPTVYEGFGAVVVEAMAAGTPVVTTPTGAAVDFISDGENGLLVPARDATALAAAVNRLLGDPALARTMGERARERVRGLTWSATARATEQAYERALAWKHRRRNGRVEPRQSHHPRKTSEGASC